MSKDKRFLVTELRKLLRSGANESLGQLIVSLGAQEVINEEVLKIARVMAHDDVAILIATLAVENEIPLEGAAFWRDVYLSLKQGQVQPALVNQASWTSMAMVVQALSQNQELSQALLQTCMQSAVLPQIFELVWDQLGISAAQTVVAEMTQAAVPVQRPIWRQIINATAYRDDYTPSEQRVAYHVLTQTLKTQVDTWQAPKAALFVDGMTAQAAARAGEYEQAARLMRDMLRYSDNTAVAAMGAQNFAKAGQIEAAIGLMDHLINMLLALRAQTGSAVQRDRILFPLPGQDNYNPDAARQALADLVATAEEAGVQPFLVSGTLLGYAREKQVLAHDKDIDLGVLGKDQLDKLVAAVRAKGNFRVVDEYYGDKEPVVQQPLRHEATGVWIDIFVYHAEGDHVFTGVDIQFGYRQTFQFTPFELEAVDFMGSRIYVPENFDLKLAENYGDWHTPDKHYVSHVESPSLIEKGTPTHRLAARVWLVRSLQYGDPVRFERMLAKLDEIEPQHQTMHQGWRERYLKAAAPADS